MATTASYSPLAESNAVASTRVTPSLRVAIGDVLGDHGLDQRYSDDGGLYVSEIADAHVSWSLVPLSVSRAGAPVSDLRPSTPKRSGGRTSYAMGVLDSWYATSTAGIEQGFTVVQRPSGEASTFTINLRSSGSLRPKLLGHRALALRTASGSTVLTYSHLRVTDARGRVLSSRLIKLGDRIGIVVNDRHATYPLTVDPLTQQAQLVGKSGEADDEFGADVAVSDNGAVAIVGAPGHSPLANDAAADTGEVYLLSGANWATQTLLADPNDAEGDDFGISVALSANGSVALVGADSELVSGVAVGPAYVYSGSNWSQRTELNEPSGAANDLFGAAVALSANGEVALVTASNHKVDTTPSEGEAYVFDGTNYGTKVDLTEPNGVTGTGFGESSALSGTGTVAVIGVGNTDGQVVIYSGTDWADTKVMTDPTTGETDPVHQPYEDQYGKAVAVSGDGTTVAIGAPSSWSGNTPGVGEVYVLSGSDFGIVTDLTDANGTNSEAFGESVSLNENGLNLLVGAPGAMGGENFSVGEAFLLSGLNWATSKTLTASNGESYDFFGGAVALSADGSTAMMGSINQSAGNSLGQDQGEVYVFTGPSTATLPSTGQKPSAPLHVVAKAKVGSVAMAWKPPASTGGSSIKRYVVTSKPQKKTCVTTGGLTCTVKGLLYTKKYVFTVVAYNAVGASPSSAPSAPVAPLK
jgi:hypothetical protein